MTGPERLPAAGSQPGSGGGASGEALVLVHAAAAGALLGRRALPWLLIVARGQRDLAGALEELFRDDARVRVIENRREDQALLPRPVTPRPRRRFGR